MRSRVLLLILAGALSCTPAVPVSGPDGPPEREPVARHLDVRAASGGNGVRAVRVCATGTGRGDERCGTTGADGRVAFDLPSGTYLLRATPPAGARLEEARQGVDLTTGSATTVIALEGLALVGGTVRDDAGALVNGASVCAHATVDGATFCVSSHADGRYAVRVKPGVYKVEIQSSPGARLVAQWARGRVDSYEADTIDVRASDELGVDVALIRGFVIDGVVTDGRDGRPLEEAQICTSTLAAPLPWNCDKTDKVGTYRVVREPGQYWVWTIPSDTDGEQLRYQYHRFADTGMNAAPLILDRDVRYDVALRTGPRLVGRVTLPDGTPLVGAHVCVDTPFATGRICRETKGDGSYVVTTRPETYVLQIQPPSGSRAVGTWWRSGRSWNDADPVEIRSADTRVDIVLAAGVLLRGNVLTADGVPIEEAPVNVSDARGFLVGGYTDPHGHYEIAVPKGSYTVDVFAPRVSQLLSVPGKELRIDADTTYDVKLPFASP
ncbi:MAG: carboxypeptidase regulatory-like domain-containing protein [Chloroflexi bacterium]|nr:carboxypeptidase regulatory-like domain-containing protein [Chloroflexota bacterium]